MSRPHWDWLTGEWSPCLSDRRLRKHTTVAILLAVGHRRDTPRGLPLQQIKVLVQRGISRQRGLKCPLSTRAHPAIYASVTVGNMIKGDLHGDSRQVVIAGIDFWTRLTFSAIELFEEGGKGPGPMLLWKGVDRNCFEFAVLGLMIEGGTSDEYSLSTECVLERYGDWRWGWLFDLRPNPDPKRGSSDK